MKTAMQELKERLVEIGFSGVEPFIDEYVEKEKQQIINAFVAGEKNIDFPALHGQGTLSTYTKYFEEVYKITDKN